MNLYRMRLGFAGTLPLLLGMASAQNGVVRGIQFFCFAPGGGVVDTLEYQNSDQQTTLWMGLPNGPEGYEAKAKPFLKAKVTLLQDKLTITSGGTNTGDVFWNYSLVQMNASGPYSFANVFMAFFGPSKSVMDYFCGGTFYGPDGLKWPASKMYWTPRFLQSGDSWVPNAKYDPKKDVLKK